MKQNKLVVLLPIAVLVLGIIITNVIIPWLFSSQYNSNGVSYYLVVTLDKTQEREFVGTLDGYYVYIEGFKIEETNFRNVNAENVSIKEAIEKKLVSIEDWKKSASRIKKDGNVEILKFDNYEIAISNGDCFIRPKS